MTATIKDICRATGFSTATVSRVLNDSPLVIEATRKKVRAALKKMGYQPHPAAPDLFDDAVIADPLGHYVVEVVQRGRFGRQGGQHRRGIIGLQHRQHRCQHIRLIRQHFA